MARFNKKFYDMVRDDMRESPMKRAADATNEVIDNVMDAYGNAQNRIVAKMYMKNFMMGNLSAIDFAQMMAENDDIRNTVSDLCRLRLEPPEEFNVQRDGSYVDLGAGLKTFWAEMKVPIPSEVQAARDARNLAIGINAGRGMRDDAEETARKPSFKERLNGTLNNIKQKADDVKQQAAAAGVNMANAAVEKLTPIADGTSKMTAEEYAEDVKTKKARELENIVMDIEAGKDQNLEQSERQKAFEAAGLDSESAKKEAQKDGQNGYKLKSDNTLEELNRPASDEINDLLKQINRHMKTEDTKAVKEHAEAQADAQANVQANVQANIPADDLPIGFADGRIYYMNLSIKDAYKDHKFTEDEARSLFNGESITFEYTDSKKNTRTATGKLEWQEYDGHKYFGFKNEAFEKTTSKFNVQTEKQVDTKEQTEKQDNELLFGKYHTNFGYAGESNPEHPSQIHYVDPNENKLIPLTLWDEEKGEYVANRIEGSWNGHNFTKEEVESMFRGESITFDYKDDNGVSQTITGKLKMETINDEDTFSFDANAIEHISSKSEEQAQPQDTFTAGVNEIDYQMSLEETYKASDRFSAADLYNMFGDDQRSDEEQQPDEEQDEEINLTDADVADLSDSNDVGLSRQ